MSGIIRVKKNRRYFVASNEPFNDERLSWEARGVMGYLLSKPDDWVVRNADLIEHGPAGKNKMDRILKELKDHGYMRRYQYRTEAGTLDWVTEIFESPGLNPDLDPETTIPPKSGYGSIVEKRSTIPPKTVNGFGGYIVNTDSLNTEKNMGADAPSEDLQERKAQKKPKTALMEHFQESTGLSFPRRRSDKKFWWSTIAEIYELADKDLPRAKELIDQALARLAGLTVSDPNSLLKTIRALVAKPPPSGPALSSAEREAIAAQQARITREEEARAAAGRDSPQGASQAVSKMTEQLKGVFASDH